MKTLKLLFALMITTLLLNSCTVVYDDVSNEFDTNAAIERLVTDYDLWYVDYHRTTGSGEIPFMSKAFTISFRNGILYANNNIVDIGRTGNGLGVSVGTYGTFNGLLETDHTLDAFNDFEIYQVSANELRLYSYSQNVSYYLIGYQTDTFDYDKLFYENIEYFLQEFVTWEKTGTQGGVSNAFDAENYLQFTPENITTFYSSQDPNGVPINTIEWNYVGAYEIFDVADYEDVKILSLNYDGGDIEEFELTIDNDETISLYHIETGTVYSFSGLGYIQYLKGQKTSAKTTPVVRNNNRKRTIVKRQIKQKRI